MKHLFYYTWFSARTLEAWCYWPFIDFLISVLDPLPQFLTDRFRYHAWIRVSIGKLYPYPRMSRQLFQCQRLHGATENHTRHIVPSPTWLSDCLWSNHTRQCCSKPSRLKFAASSAPGDKMETDHSRFCSTVCSALSWTLTINYTFLLFAHPSSNICSRRTDAISFRPIWCSFRILASKEKMLLLLISTRLTGTKMTSWDFLNLRGEKIDDVMVIVLLLSYV